MFLGEVTFSNIQHYEITGHKKNDISNLELEDAIKHGKFNLKRGGVLKGGDNKNADI